jgi:hypothetical protein
VEPEERTVQRIGDGRVHRSGQDDTEQMRLADCTSHLYYLGWHLQDHIRNVTMSSSIHFWIRHILNQCTVESLLRRGYVLEYLVLNRIVVKQVLFKWFKLR